MLVFYRGGNTSRVSENSATNKVESLNIKTPSCINESIYNGSMITNNQN